MTAWAVVDLRRGALFVLSHSSPRRGRFFNGWFRKLDESVPDDELGRVVRMALAESKTGVPQPNLRVEPEEWKLHRQAAGVRTYGQYMKGTREVGVVLDDSPLGLRLTPRHNGGARDGWISKDEDAISLDHDSSDSDLGRSIRAALELCD